ncbi:ATP-binding protein [Roseisolibacter sp. H3M3-2]|uniref:sensor histidine kinase n=1 Tax=Roseisolibacter sp. H3M3-2 TaxID=3031323 RepID=UPI0023DC2C30|nr:ATP-binding protein [Roseisolibacter sp. H3M3-2]MDF1505093.1 histidine kinase [Roseisolibacter sp. H3M3-2]
MSTLSTTPHATQAAALAPARPTPGEGAAASGAARDAAGRRTWRQAIVQVPLLRKLVWADLVINVSAYVVMRQATSQWADEIMIGSLLVTLTLNAALVYWALLPLRALEATARRVSSGDLAARVPVSRSADRDLTRIGMTLNALLDSVTADRLRMRALAAQVISAGDQERAHIARELHDSTAQQLSALEMLVTSSVREVPSGPLHERLAVMREIVVESLAEVRTLSHNVHPRVLDDLGLAAALEFLARRTREQSGVETRVVSDVRGVLPKQVASVFYRVAQEALRNAVRHAEPGTVRVRLAATGGSSASLEVTDDGRGFDVAAAEGARDGMGLFVMRERVALIDGRLEVRSQPGRGTTVRAVVPLSPLGAPELDP